MPDPAQPIDAHLGVVLAQPDRANRDVMGHEVIVEHGVQRCNTCGKPHDCRQLDHDDRKRWATWADPDDGHPYRSEGWEQLARAYISKFGPPLEALDRQEATRR